MCSAIAHVPCNSKANPSIKMLLSRFFLSFQSILHRGCPHDVFIFLYLVLLDCHGTQSLPVLEIYLIKGLLLKHDYLAFKRRYWTKFVYHNQQAKLRFTACHVYFSICWHYNSLKKILLYRKGNTHQGYIVPRASKMLHPAHLCCTNVPGYAAPCGRFRGGGQRVSLFPYALLKDYTVYEGCSIDRGESSRYRFVDHVDNITLLQYASEGYVHTTLPLSQLLGLLPKAQAQKVARVHNLHVSARSTSGALAALATDHHCPQCTTYTSVFSAEPSKAKLSNAWLRNHRHKKQQTQPLNLEEFPPEPFDHSLRDKIISSACKKMLPASFEEGGCAVCGELKPSHELSRLKNIKNQLHVLRAAGVTRVERKETGDSIREFTGPVLDYSCSRVCNDCRACLRRGRVPCLALANGLWLGSVPTELKSLWFVEKMLIARVQHTCANVKVASGMQKMKANIVAFELPTPKVYNMLPPPRQDMDDVLAVLFTGPCKPTPEDFKHTPLLVCHNYVIRALEWLKLNHADYADIEISHSNINEYSEDSPSVTIEYRVAESNKVPEGTSVFDTAEEDGTEEGECPYTVHGLLGEDLDTMLSNQIKATALRHLNSGGKMLAVGHAGKPETIYNNPQLYSQMFP